jgi:hypothetical protein
MTILSLKQQIARKCIHFNGIMNKCCKAGIKYEDVRTGKPFQFPCLQTGGECASAAFRSEAEVEKELKEMEQMGVDTVTALILIKDHVKKTSAQSGKIKCQCGGELVYSIAAVNGHVHAACKSCGIRFME